MPASFKDILNSRLFKFIVGENVDGHSTTFSVHEDAISQLSTPLYSILKNGMQESQTGGTVWKDAEEIRAEPAPALEPAPMEVHVREKYPTTPGPVHSADFSSLSYPLLGPRDNYDSTCEPSGTFDKDQSYSEQLLSHAALYILGDYHLIDSLKALALYKLHKTLCVFELSGESAQDVIDLARFAYTEEGGGGGSQEGIGELRNLVCRYMAENALVLSFEEKFMELLGEGGQFVKDFFKFEVQRI